MSTNTKEQQVFRQESRDKLAEALAQYEAALLFAYPEGARGAAFDCWNKARQALAAHEAEQALPLKDRPDFIAGYDAGLKDGRACERRDAAEQAAQAVPAGFKLAPHYRGYALLGTGRYLIDSTDAPADPELGAELIISIASEKDREGREIGERRDMPARTIQPDDMAVRIGFANERGLFALEDQLWTLRQEHWPGTKSAAMIAAAQSATVEEWERALSAVMPLDFKDWWENSRSEWPAVAAAVIRSQRADCELGWKMAAEAAPAPEAQAARAALAQRQPLTEQQIMDGWRDECPPSASLDVFTDGVMFAERAHGIGATTGEQKP